MSVGDVRGLGPIRRSVVVGPVGFVLNDKVVVSDSKEDRSGGEMEPGKSACERYGVGVLDVADGVR